MRGKMYYLTNGERKSCFKRAFAKGNKILNIFRGKILSKHLDVRSLNTQIVFKEKKKTSQKYSGFINKSKNRTCGIQYIVLCDF